MTEIICRHFLYLNMKSYINVDLKNGLALLCNLTLQRITLFLKYSLIDLIFLQSDFLHLVIVLLYYFFMMIDSFIMSSLLLRMFTDSCRRLRIMKGSEAIGLGISYWLNNGILFLNHGSNFNIFEQKHQRILSFFFFFPNFSYNLKATLNWLVLNFDHIFDFPEYQFEVILILSESICLLPAPRAMEKCKNQT